MTVVSSTLSNSFSSTLLPYIRTLGGQYMCRPHAVHDAGTRPRKLHVLLRPAGGPQLVRQPVDLAHQLDRDHAGHGLANADHLAHGDLAHSDRALAISCSLALAG
jgi:hypothetical protein